MIISKLEGSLFFIFGDPLSKSSFGGSFFVMVFQENKIVILEG